MNEIIVYYGTELKLNVSIEPIGGYSMDDYDFDVEFYCYSNRKVMLNKSALIKDDSNNYLAIVDTKNLGTGALKCRVTAQIPDADCNDGIRTEVLVLDTGIQVMGA